MKNKTETNSFKKFYNNNFDIILTIFIVWIFVLMGLIVLSEYIASLTQNEKDILMSVNQLFIPFVLIIFSLFIFKYQTDGINWKKLLLVGVILASSFCIMPYCKNSLKLSSMSNQVYVWSTLVISFLISAAIVLICRWMWLNIKRFCRKLANWLKQNVEITKVIISGIFAIAATIVAHILS